MYAIEKGTLAFGPANTTAVLFEELMDSKALWLTPNTTSVYMTTWMELGDEPMVIETPPNVLGFINDAWFKYVTDFGNAGPDKGKGGKFLILPPGYEGEVPGRLSRRANHDLRQLGHLAWIPGRWVTEACGRCDQEALPDVSALPKRQSAEDDLRQHLG